MGILVIILGYLLGSIPSGLIVGKLWFGIDIREHGSGNLGATNSFRILGKKAGAIVTIVDILKGTLATLLPLLLHVDVNPLFIGACAVIGHMFPIFAKFKGGKAVATSAGVFLGYNPPFFLILLAIFLCLLFITKIVSLTSMLIAIAAVILAITTASDDIAFIVCVCLLAVFVIYRHRANITRIINKTEPKISFSSKK